MARCPQRNPTQRPGAVSSVGDAAIGYGDKVRQSLVRHRRVISGPVQLRVVQLFDCWKNVGLGAPHFDVPITISNVRHCLIDTAGDFLCTNIWGSLWIYLHKIIRRNRTMLWYGSVRLYVARGCGKDITSAERKVENTIEVRKPKKYLEK